MRPSALPRSVPATPDADNSSGPRTWNKKIVAPCLVSSMRGIRSPPAMARSAILHLDRGEGRWQVTRAEALSKLLFASEQQTPIWLDGLLYAVLPKDAGEHREELVCFDPGGKGRVLWTSGKDNRFGLGPCLAADGKLYVLDDRGWLSLVRLDRDAFRLLARAQVIAAARDAWGPPALVDGKLLLRDATRLICLDIGKHVEPKEK